MRLDRTDVANLRAAGLTVVELPGWQSRGRPGPHQPVGLLTHHTGGSADSRAYVDWMTLTGRPDLNPPLCQIAWGRAGTVYVCASGRANHAGKARKVRSWQTTTDGNADMIGGEAMNTGTEGWSGAQRGAMALTWAVLCKRRGWDEQHVLAHKETSTTGKWDPGGLDMGGFRTDVAQRIRALGKPPSPPPPQEDIVASITDLQRVITAALPAIGKAVLDAKIRNALTGKDVPLRDYVHGINRETHQSREALKVLATHVSPEARKAVEAAMNEAGRTK